MESSIFVHVYGDSGNGKSTVAGAIALYLQKLGHQVVLMDDCTPHTCGNMVPITEEMGNPLLKPMQTRRKVLVTAGESPVSPMAHLEK